MNLSLEMSTNQQKTGYEHMTMMGIYPVCYFPLNQPESVSVITTESVKKEESRSGEGHTESIKLKELVPKIIAAQKLMMTAYQIANRRKKIYHELLEEYKRIDRDLAMKDGRYKIVKPKHKSAKKQVTLADLSPAQIEELKRSLGLEV